MLPNHVLSNPYVFGTYLFPDSINTYRDLCWEKGGVALNDATQGLEVRDWLLFADLDTGDVWLGADGVLNTLLFTRPGITDVSLAFDQNMNPFVAFVQDGVSQYWWWDPFTASMEFVTLPVGVGTPQVTLDDKRDLHISESDILMFYVRAGNLYFREQRDRFLIEYLLATGVVGQAIKGGMGTGLRVQIMVGFIPYSNIPEPPPAEQNFRRITSGDRRKTTNGRRLYKSI